MEEDHAVERFIADLEESCGWHHEAAGTLQDMLARLPDTPATEVQRASASLLLALHLAGGRSAAAATATILEIRDRAASRSHRTLHARAERALSRVFIEIGDSPRALEHAVAALALDGDDLPPALRCRLRLALADALSESGAYGEARHRHRDALEQARALGTPGLPELVLNNWAYTELLAGDPGAASGLAEQLLALMAEHRVTMRVASAGTVAEVLHALGRSDEAVTMLRAHLRAHLRDEGREVSYDVAGCWLTLAQVERETGDLDAAGASLDTADRLATAHELHGLRVEGIGARAELLDARGDHAGAYEAHLRFHAETLALGTAAADARAQTLHAVFEADQARRESARYREMSYRDPLTGLYNRRHVDEDLDARLARRGALTVAMVDLDHFKRVNDTCSHEAGDAVLVRLAALLETAAAQTPGAYAARLGGEEFLLVLPGADLRAAHAVVEALRQRVAADDWSGIAPGVPVTASIGIAARSNPREAAIGRTGLLREADRHLYAAKAGGRDRVEPSLDPLAAQGVADR